MNSRASLSVAVKDALMRQAYDKLTYGSAWKPGKLAQAGGTSEDYWVYEE